MMTKTIWFECLNDDCKADAITVIKQMGWSIDTEHPTSDGGFLVTFPEKDESLFKLLYMCWS